MCGIAGFCNFEYDYTQKSPFYTKILTDMHDCLSHRGNDQFGHCLKKNVGLSHARLSIRDITKGIQPMSCKIGEREYAIVYNGEIYNTSEMVADLKAAGYTFTTTSDTEVILYAFIHYGVTFVNRLNGIFAFAIWDNARGQLYWSAKTAKPFLPLASV